MDVLKDDFHYNRLSVLPKDLPCTTNMEFMVRYVQRKRRAQTRIS